MQAPIRVADVANLIKHSADSQTLAIYNGRIEVVKKSILYGGQGIEHYVLESWRNTLEGPVRQDGGVILAGKNVNERVRTILSRAQYWMVFERRVLYVWWLFQSPKIRHACSEPFLERYYRYEAARWDQWFNLSLSDQVEHLNRSHKLYRPDPKTPLPVDPYKGLLGFHPPESKMAKRWELLDGKLKLIEEEIRTKEKR